MQSLVHHFEAATSHNDCNKLSNPGHDVNDDFFFARQLWDDVSLLQLLPSCVPQNFILIHTCPQAVRHADMALQGKLYPEVASGSWSVLGPAAAYVICFQRLLNRPELAPQHQRPDSMPHEKAVADQVLPCANQHLHVFRAMINSGSND